MSNLKRFLSLTLAIMMVVGGMASTVSAKTFSDVDKKTDPELANAVSLLNDLDVVRGTSADGLVLDGDALVTRAQFALFMARIRTATPEYFYSLADLPDTDSEKQELANKYFDDLDPVRDAPYIIAINYCAENGIVEGKEARKYHPTESIKLQEAVKMCTIALGWTGLSYPQGYLSKAAEADVALLGANVETPGFDFKGVSALKEITRAEMVEILYNFLLSKYVYLDMVWNAVDSRYESRSKYEDVISKFGIQKITGYVGGIVGYGTSLKIRNIADPSGDIWSWIRLSGESLGTKAATDSVYSEKKADIQLVYPKWTSQYNSITNSSSYSLSQDVINTTVADLGLYEEDGTTLRKPTELLGLKVVIYRDIRKNPIYKVTLPASRVVGDKIDVTDAKNDAKTTDKTRPTATTYPETYVESVQSLTLGVSKDDTRTYDQEVKPYDILREFNLYAFTQGAILVSDDYDYTADGGYNLTAKNRGVDIKEDTIEKELGKFLKNKGNYKLEYVNNGVDARGLPEFFYIFRPFVTGYYAGVKDGNLRLNDTYDHARYTIPDNANTKRTYLEEGVTSFTVGDAYLYTYYGNNLDVYKKLAKINKDVKALVVDKNLAIFEGNKSVPFNFKTAAQAIAGFELAYGNFEKDNGYSLYAYNDTTKNDIFYAYNTAPAKAPEYKPYQYGVILDYTADSTTINTPSRVVYPDSTIGYVYYVFNATTQEKREIVITGTDDPRKADGLRPGDYISLVLQSNGGYKAGVPGNASFFGSFSSADSSNILMNFSASYKDYAIYTGLHDTLVGTSTISTSNGDIEFTGRGGGVWGLSTTLVGNSFTTPTYNPGNRVFRIDMGGLNPPKNPADAKTSESTIVDSNTIIIIVGTDNSTTNPRLVAARRISIGELDTYVNDPANNNLLISAAFVAKNYGTTGAANVIFLTIADNIRPAAPVAGRYGIVVDPSGWVNDTVVISGVAHGITATAIKTAGYFATKQAFVYSENKVIDICADRSDKLDTGAYIRLTGDYITATIDGKERNFYVVDEVTENKLSGTGWIEYGANNANVLTQVATVLNRGTFVNDTTPPTGVGARTQSGWGQTLKTVAITGNTNIDVRTTVGRVDKTSIIYNSGSSAITVFTDSIDPNPGTPTTTNFAYGLFAPVVLPLNGSNITYKLLYVTSKKDATTGLPIAAFDGANPATWVGNSTISSEAPADAAKGLRAITEDEFKNKCGAVYVVAQEEVSSQTPWSSTTIAVTFIIVDKTW